MTFATLLLAMSVSAQQYQNVSDTPFNKGKMYASAGFSGLDLNYNSTTKWNLNIDGKVGYFLVDDVMALAEAQWGIHQEYPNDFIVGAASEKNSVYSVSSALKKSVFRASGVRYIFHFSLFTFHLSRALCQSKKKYYH